MATEAELTSGSASAATERTEEPQLTAAKALLSAVRLLEKSIAAEHAASSSSTATEHATSSSSTATERARRVLAQLD